MLKTNRLVLRQWTEDDFLPFSEMCGDKDVMEFFPRTQTREESFKTGKKIQALIEERGWGLWALEVPDQHKFIGFTGLHIPEENMPCSPCVEIGWRLSKQHWGKGYAVEAAKATLKYAFAKLNLEEIVSFTATVNVRSMSVMKKIGMHDSGQNFRHPNIDAGHPLSEHVLYKIHVHEWNKII